TLLRDADAPYLELRQPFDRMTGLVKSEKDQPPPDLSLWLEPLKNRSVPYRINHVVVPSGSRRGSAWMELPTALWRDRQHWELLAINGRLSIFGWKGTEAGSDPGPFRGQQFDANKLAFGANVPADSRSPEEGPMPPVQRGPWVDFALGPV